MQRSKTPVKRSTDIYVANLAIETTEEDLLRLFESCGRVLEVRISRDASTNFSKAYVTMQDLREAQNAIEALSNKIVHNKAMVLILDQQGEFLQRYA
jgi:RNA recognition motif-containing protein